MTTTNNYLCSLSKNVDGMNEIPLISGEKTKTAFSKSKNAVC